MTNLQTLLVQTLPIPVLPGTSRTDVLDGARGMWNSVTKIFANNTFSQITEKGEFGMTLYSQFEHCDSCFL